MGRVRNAASRLRVRARGTGSDMLDTVKRDPVPIAMVGVGIAWLLFNRKTHHDGNGHLIAEKSEALKAKTGELTGSVQAKAEDLSRIARERGSELAGKARDTAARFGTTAQEQARGLVHRFQDLVEHNPFAAASAAFAFGAAIGLSIPVSAKERDLMGSAGESLIGRAKATAQETMHKAQHAASKAMETAKQEFK